jgi:hypothetical protein
MTVTREFTEDDIEDLDLPSECHTSWMNGDDHRWSYGMSGVFEFEESNWEIDWQIGASEEQDSNIYPWDSYEFPITATKVVLLPVVVQKWVPASE